LPERVTARFITLEGGEGVGKSTQLKRLANAIRARGHEVIESREPGGSPGAEAIRALLLQGEGDRWTAQAEALLFAAARADHVARTIRPALEGGRWVVCDRFVDSSIAYQGIAGGLGEVAVRQLHTIGSDDIYPDRTLLLHCDSEEAEGRTRLRDLEGKDRIGGRERAYHHRVAEAFAALAAKEPDRFVVIDTGRPHDEVTARLIAAIEDLL
jgi:dTMP kinase